jgi:hypothetical protein
LCDGGEDEKQQGNAQSLEHDGKMGL